MRHIRTVLAVLLFLATLCLALVAALSFWITPERVSARLASALETHLGLRAELSGELALKRLPELEITVPRGALKSAATGEARGEFAAAVIRMKPWAIFANSPRVDEVLIDGLELSVSAASAAEAAGGATSSKAFWNISLVDLRNGSLALEPGVLGDAAVSLEALEARLENLDETGGTVRLAANLKADPASGALTLAGLFRFLPGAGPLPERLSIESASASLDGLWSGRSLEPCRSAAFRNLRQGRLLVLLRRERAPHPHRTRIRPHRLHRAHARGRGRTLGRGLRQDELDLRAGRSLALRDRALYAARAARRLRGLRSGPPHRPDHALLARRRGR